MPFVTPPDPFTRPPRLDDAASGSPWDGRLDVDAGYAVLRDVDVDGSLYLDETCTDLELIDCRLTGTALADTPDLRLEINRCTLTTCDLSRVELHSASRSRFDGCKLIGTNLAGGLIEDVAFANCTLRYSNLRMASFQRVRFTDCQLDEVDFYDSGLTDVRFAGSELRSVVMDKCRLDRVDLRGAPVLGLTSVGDLQGALISQDQVIELATLFALSSGVSIERVDQD